MWGIAHSQGIRLPTKDYWEFREIITVGPDRNIWYTKGSTVGRVTPDGTITEFKLPSNGATGLTAGSDRQPPARLANRLWIAMSAANKIAFLQFQ